MSKMEQLRALEKVQELDLVIDSLKKKQADLPVQLKQLDQKILALETQVAELIGKKTDQEKIVRQTQAAQDLNNDRLTRTQQRLGNIENTREFAATNLELQQIQKLNTQLEETKTKAQSEVEGFQKNLDQVQGELSTFAGERQVKSAELAQTGSGIESELQALLKNRQASIEGIDRGLLSKYDRVRVKRAGVGIASTMAGRCRACNMGLPPQLYNQIKRGEDFHDCPNCHRILFVPNEAELAQTVATMASVAAAKNA